MKQLVCIGCPKGCNLTVDEENDYAVSGNGCEVGHTYWFEYVHDTNDGEKPDADAFYRILSEYNYLSEVYITDEELANNFREIKEM